MLKRTIFSLYDIERKFIFEQLSLDFIQSISDCDYSYLYIIYMTFSNVLELAVVSFRQIR